MPENRSQPPLMIPLLPSSASSFLPPLRRGQCQSGVCRVPTRVKKCRSWVIGGGGGYLPPESLSCPAHGGVQSEYGGYPGLFPCPYSPWRGTPPTPLSLGKIPDRVGGTQELWCYPPAPPPWPTLFWDWQCATSDLAARYAEESGHRTLYFWQAWYYRPSTFI